MEVFLFLLLERMGEMKIKNLFKEKKLVYSFEVFPPKEDLPLDRVFNTIERLSEIRPDYISVTYGAGGSTLNNRTSILSSRIKNNQGIESLAHLTCIGATKKSIDGILKELEENNVENILALRGDMPEEGFIPREFKNSQDLISYIKTKGNFGIGAACYPEGHIETKVKDLDIDILGLKKEAGADYFISQLFFDNNLFYDFLNKVEKKGIRLPIQAGIMPVINKRQIERIVSMCGATLPQKFIRILNKYQHDSIALRDAGIAYATEQIVDLITWGVEGIHLYTMNNTTIANNITDNISSLIQSINSKKVI